MKKRLVFLILINLLLISGCGSKNSTTEIINNNTQIEEIPFKYIVDPSSTTRPYAVMINTHNEALPQAGLQDAYIVYELMVEGGITRMMALFKDITSDRIGSVRSARTQYLDYALENDAIYVHAGGANDALIGLRTLNIPDVDVDGVYGFRDTSLNRAFEHTLFTKTSLLETAVNNKGIKKTTDVKNILTYSKEEIDLSKYQSSVEAKNISIKYSYYRTSNYTYDEANKVYLRSMNDTKNTDLVTHKEYTVKNIIVYGLNYSSYTYDNYSLYQRIDNIGSGEGYYITDGKALPITWSKTSKSSQTTYKIKETNDNLVVNNGNTYIQIYPTSGILSIN